jgi:hypothetical protein
VLVGRAPALPAVARSPDERAEDEGRDDRAAAEAVRGRRGEHDDAERPGHAVAERPGPPPARHDPRDEGERDEERRRADRQLEALLPGDGDPDRDDAEGEEVVQHGERHRDPARLRVRELELVENPAEHRDGGDQQRAGGEEDERRTAHVDGDVLREQEVDEPGRGARERGASHGRDGRPAAPLDDVADVRLGRELPDVEEDDEEGAELERRLHLRVDERVLGARRQAAEERRAEERPDGHLADDGRQREPLRDSAADGGSDENHSDGEEELRGQGFTS